MKRMIAGIIFVFVLPYNVNAQIYWAGQDSSNLPLITITGEAEVRVVPDEVVLTLGVETTDKVMERSKSQNDERVRKVLDRAKNLGVDPKYIQTSYIGVEPWYRRGLEYPDSLEYRVRKTIAITLKDTTKFESLLSQVLEAGASHVHGIQFRTTELRKHRDAARALAIKAAREKAVALAAELGQKVGKAYRISEYGSGWYSPYGSWWGSSWGGGMSQNVAQNSGSSASTGDGTLALGQVTVTASVSVSFFLQ